MQCRRSVSEYRGGCPCADPREPVAAPAALPSAPGTAPPVDSSSPHVGRESALSPRGRLLC